MRCVTQQYQKPYRLTLPVKANHSCGPKELGLPDVDEPNGRVEQHYATLENRWTVTDGVNEYGRLVVPFGNSEDAIHRWFHFKEAYSSQLLARVVKDLNLDSRRQLRILDCFAGGGTTLVSAVQMASDFPDGVLATGIERNPFLYHLASTKARVAASAESGLISQINDDFAVVQSQFEVQLKRRHQVPELTTWQNDHYFPPRQRRRLLALHAAVKDLKSSMSRDVLLLCAAAAVEPSSRLRRDGRTLRFAESKILCDPWEEFSRRVEVVIEDLAANVPRKNVRAAVHLGDGRKAAEYIDEDQQFDLIIFSPPYPNNIDYTEVYKTEAWYLGAYGSQEDFRNQRLSTVRSHPSVKYEDRYYYSESENAAEVERLLAPLLAAVPEDRYQSGREMIIRGYADDMLAVLQSARTVIANDGRLAFVVGNSVHGAPGSNFVIAADLIMARLAELSSWRVEEIRIARTLHRRRVTSPYLRESMVILRPSE
jgi:hypothetical protein